MEVLTHMKNIIIGLGVGILSYFLIFGLLGFEGVIGWVIFVISGIMFVLFFLKVSRQKKQNMDKKLYLNINDKDLLKIAMTVKQNKANYEPGFEWLFEYYSSNDIQKDIDNTIENERIKYIDNFLTKNGIYCNLPNLNTDTASSSLILKIEKSKYEIGCAMIRECNMKILLMVFKKYYSVVVHNARKKILLPDDERLIKIYWECHQYPKGSLAVGINVKLSEVDYYKHFERKIITKENILKDLSILESEYNISSFYIINEILSEYVNMSFNDILEMLKLSPDRGIGEFLYSNIANTVLALLETGKFHSTQGVLNSTGRELQKIFEMSYYFLLKLQAKDIDKDYVSQQIERLRKNVKIWG
jgi:hypothetical protein